MKTGIRYHELETSDLIHQGNVEIVESLRALSERYIGRAHALREMVESDSGRMVKIGISCEDKDVVLLALVVMVRDDIGGCHDAGLRTKYLKTLHSVIDELELDFQDVMHLGRYSQSIAQILLGS